MWLRRLDIDGVRNLAGVRLELSPGVCGFFGDNGAGKTSLLEAVYCLSSGRSFRGGARAEFIRHEAEGATIFAEVVEGERVRRLGLSRSRRDWQARLDGETLETLEAMARTLAVQVFHPRLHQLVEGSPDERRKFLDFGVFHVEHGFIDHWRAYRRALRQRNASLRQGAGEREVRLWEPALVQAAEAVTAARSAVVNRLGQRLEALLQRLAPELRPVRLELYPGWRAEESLAEVLGRTLDRDRQQAHTGAGPHRGDLRLADERGGLAGILSRGQQKAVVLGLTLAMQGLVAEETGRPPVLCIDDFSSELDAAHQTAVLETVAAAGGQALITGTERPPHADLDQVFHVEQGRVQLVL